MGVASLGCGRKILFLLDLFSIFCCCLLFVEILASILNLLLRHHPDASLQFTITGHMPFLVTVITFHWWALHPISVNVHRIRVVWRWSLWLLLLLLPIQLQQGPGSLSQQGQQWRWWSWCLCGGFPWCTLIDFAVKGLFSLCNSPLAICSDRFIVPLFNHNRAWTQLGQTSPESLVQGSLELND